MILGQIKSNCEMSKLKQIVCQHRETLGKATTKLQLSYYESHLCVNAPKLIPLRHPYSRYNTVLGEFNHLYFFFNMQFYFRLCWLNLLRLKIDENKFTIK